MEFTNDNASLKELKKQELKLKMEELVIKENEIQKKLSLFEEETNKLNLIIDDMKSISEEANIFLKKLGFFNLPELEIKKCEFYSTGPFITSPFLHYLIENKYYESHGSGDEDYGVMIKNFMGIRIGSFVKIESLDKNTFKITRVVEKVDEKLLDVICEADYDMRVFKLLGFKLKSMTIKMDFTGFGESDEEY